MMPGNDGVPGPWHEAPAARTKSASRQIFRAGTRILCVAEDQTYCEQEIVPALQRAGLQVEVMPAEPRAVIDRLARSFHLILFDISSPGGLGHQACAQVRSACGLPLMLVLHGSARGEVLRGYQAGADAYILAPFDPREFLARLSGLLRCERVDGGAASDRTDAPGSSPAAENP
jgi:DNA-binding response OmpR family regulator